MHDLRYIGMQALKDMYDRGRGTSKNWDKHHDRAAMSIKIYSTSTYNDYRRHWNEFCNQMRADGIKAKTLEEAKSYVPRYMEELKSHPGQQPGTTMSAWSVRAYMAPVCKVLGVSVSEYDPPKRHRDDILRSRFEVAKDSTFSTEKNADLINFESSVGLRNYKELHEIRGKDLIEKDGHYYVHVICGKGGKERYAPVIGPEDRVQGVVEKMRSVDRDEKVWPHIPSGADIHALRAAYACEMYQSIARPVEEIPEKDRYCCRGDRTGEVFDRQAMHQVAEALGHSRIDVIAQSYLWQL